MFSEKDFEDILVQYPELIEPNLKFIGRQVKYFGKRVDIIFEDRFKEKLIVELKKDNLTRDALSQVLEYEGYILSEKDPTARVMLIANRIPLNLKKAIEHHGIEYKELTVSFLMEFLEKKGDSLTHNSEFVKTLNNVIIQNNSELEFIEVTGDELYQSVKFFRKRIENELNYTGSKELHFPGGENCKGESFEIQTIYGLLSITVVTEENKFNRYVQFVTLDQPKNSNSSDIEINIPKFPNSRVATLIAKRNEKRILCNRGKCTVYMKALKKSEVLNHFESLHGNIVHIKENGKNTPVIKFAELDSNSLFEQIALFVFQMKSFKEKYRIV